jgi:hypothetical protein
MRGYWLRIILGMLGIFVVGYAVISAVRAGTSRVRQVTESAEPISIPLALVPFNLGDQRVGTIRRLTILRREPESVTGFRIRVNLSDLEALRMLTSNCVMTVDDPTRLSHRTSFRCVPEDSALIEFGRVELMPEGGGSRIDVPLWLPAQVVAGFSGGAGETVTVNADSIAREVRLLADSIRHQTRSLTDSLRREVAGRPPVQTP